MKKDKINPIRMGSSVMSIVSKMEELDIVKYLP